VSADSEARLEEEVRDGGRGMDEDVEDGTVDMMAGMGAVV
jgi:hypothetical protein